MTGKRGPAIDRFWPKIEKDYNGCWLWKAHLGHGNGYGRFYDGTRQVYAHRWSYEHFVAPIPAGMQIETMRTGSVTLETWRVEQAPRDPHRLGFDRDADYLATLEEALGTDCPSWWALPWVARWHWDQVGRP